MTPLDYIVMLTAIFLSRALPPIINLVIAAGLGIAAFIAGLRS